MYVLARIAGVMLDHGTPCLAFAFEEKLRVNVWSEGLKSLRLGVGPWLNEAKRAVRRGDPDDSEIVVAHDLSVPLGVLKQHALRTARGQKIAYVVDASSSSRRRFLTRMRSLPQRGSILRYVKPVTSQGERAFRDLSPSTFLPAIATRKTGFYRSGTSLPRGASILIGGGRFRAQRCPTEQPVQAAGMSRAGRHHPARLDKEDDPTEHAIHNLGA
jgi:hypothetical protein